MSRVLRECRRIRRLWDRDRILVGIDSRFTLALAAEYAFGDRAAAYEAGRALALWRR